MDSQVAPEPEGDETPESRVHRETYERYRDYVLLRQRDPAAARGYHYAEESVADAEIEIDW